MHLTLGRKMALMILVNSLLMVGAVTIALRTYRGLLEESRHGLTDTQASLLTLKKSQLEIERFKNLRTTDPMAAVGALRQLQGHVREVGEQMDRRLAALDGDRSLREVVQDGQQKIRALQERIDDALVRGQIRDIQEWTAFLTDTLDHLSHQIEQYQTGASRRIASQVQSSQTFIIIGLAVVVLGMIGFSSWIAWGIAGTANRLAEVMTTIQREGDLTKKISVNSGDEMGVLASTFNSLIESLSGIVQRIRTAADRTMTTVRESVTTISALDSASNTISQSVEGVARVSSMQARQVDKTHQTVESLLMSITKVAARAKAAADQADKASRSASEGGEAVKQSNAIMQRMYQGFHETVVVIRQLGDRSRQIGQIVDVITKIAEETNLLALNTAIEAARGGESASGFGVVAEEVRGLADKTGRAADEITRLVKETQQETTRVIGAVEAGLQQMSEGVTAMNQTGAALDQLVKIVWEVARLGEEISKMTQEQATSCQDVRRSMAAVTAAAEENVRTSHEALRSAAQQTELTKTIDAVAQELGKVSTELHDAVKSFKI